MSYRDEVIEQVAVILAESYPGNVSTNAFCAAVRSMKGRTATPVAPQTDRACRVYDHELGQWVPRAVY